MQVKVKRAHQNAHGGVLEKAVGDVYEVADDEAKGLIANGYVTAVKAEKPEAEK